MTDHEEPLPEFGHNLMVAGWGTTESGGQSSFLREATVPLATYEACNAQTGYNGFAKPESMICAGFQQGTV
jgi:hypothetical protein